MAGNPNQAKREGAMAASRGPGSSAVNASGPDTRRPTGGDAQARTPRNTELARLRANAAWRWVDQAEQKGRGDRHGSERFTKRYGTLARKLPGLLLVSGLAQTLAFLFSKGGAERDNAEWLLFSQLADHLRERFQLAVGPEFMLIVTEMSPTGYRSATREAIAVAEWLKRFVEGRLGMEEE